jgi:hypothetical protein
VLSNRIQCAIGESEMAQISAREWDRMTEGQRWNYLAGRLGEPVPSCWKEHLSEDDEITRNYGDDDEAVEDLVDRVRRLVAVGKKYSQEIAASKLSASGDDWGTATYEDNTGVGPDSEEEQLDSEEQVSGEDLLSTYEHEMADRLSQDFARRAARRKEVSDFRSRCLHGMLITNEQADSFIYSPAVRFLSLSQLEESGIDPLDRGIDVEVYGNRRKGYQAVVRTSSSRLIERECSTGECSTGNTTRLPSVPFLPESHSLLQSLQRSGAVRRRMERLGVRVSQPVDYQDVLSDKVLKDGWKRAILEGRDPFPHMFPGSAADTLAEVAQNLFPMDWTIDAAARFVLTGTVPHIDPVNAVLRSRWYTVDQTRTVLVITAEHWIREKTVSQLYRQMQQRLMEGERHRHPRAKAIALIRFVEERGGIEVERDRRRLMREEWNQQYPKWQFNPGGAFKRAYTRAQQSLQRLGA